MFQLEEDNLKSRACIKVIGVGGGGGNAIKTMHQAGLSGVEFIAANTDVQALEEHEDLNDKIQLGAELTKGLGAGANPEIGRQAAIESCDEILTAVQGADMVFITVGMGGGTGTGAAGVIARIAKQQGALVVGVVTRPFFFEGQRRARHAETGIQFLKENVDTLIIIPNQKLLKIADEHTSLVAAFKKVDKVLLEAVKGVVDLINEKGLINLDFADVKTVMSEKGLALIGVGEAEGENRAMEAGQQAISSPLLEDNSFKGASGLIINITGGPDLSLQEVNQVAEFITSEAHPDAEIIFGAIVDPRESSNTVRVTVIATGFEEKTHYLKQEEMRRQGQGSVQGLQVQGQGSVSVQTRVEDSQFRENGNPLQGPQAALGRSPEDLPRVSNVCQSREDGNQVERHEQGHEQGQGQGQTKTSLRTAEDSQRVDSTAVEQQEAGTGTPMQVFEQKEAGTTTHSSNMLNQKKGETRQTGKRQNKLPRDILLEKARAYREQQTQNASEKKQFTEPEQLSMIIQENSQGDDLQKSHAVNSNELPFKKGFKKEARKISFTGLFKKPDKTI